MGRKIRAFPGLLGQKVYLRCMIHPPPVLDTPPWIKSNQGKYKKVGGNEHSDTRAPAFIKAWVASSNTSNVRSFVLHPI